MATGEVPRGGGGSSSPQPWMSGALGLITGALGFAGARSQQNALEREARRNRRFQERMSNTAIQRRMEDMRVAGINPILAARFDASTPPGAMASGLPNAGLAGVQAGQAGVTSALAIKRQAQELKVMAAQEENIRAQTGVSRANEQLIHIQQRLQGYAADIREPAAFWLQSVMSFVPPEIRKDPAKFKAWFMEKAKAFLAEHQHSVKQTGAFLNDLWSIAQGLIQWGAGFFKEPTPEPHKPKVGKGPAANKQRAGKQTRGTRSGDGWVSVRFRN